MRRRIAATALRIIKTPDGNSKGRVEPEDGLSPLSGESSHWGEFPMGRFSASGTRLHELRQPKPAAAKPRLLVRSRASPKHHPASLPGRTRLGRWRYRAAFRAPSAEVAGPAEAAKGSAPRLLPLGPHRPHARSSAAGLLPGTRRCAPHARHPHRIPGGIGSSPAIRWGRRPSRAFANPALRAASRAYRPTSRARGPCIGGRSGNPGKSPQRCKASRKLLREQRTRAGRSRRACRTPAAALVQKAPKTALGRAATPTQVHGAQCGTREAPQERRRGMHANPKETTSLRLDVTMKRRSRELLALQTAALGGMPFAAGIPRKAR